MNHLKGDEGIETMCLDYQSSDKSVITDHLNRH